MVSPLQRLYKTKLALLATIATVLGIALLMLSDWLRQRLGGLWFSEITNDIGASLFSIGLLGVFFQYIGTADQTRADDDRVRRMLRETAPDIRDAVIDGFAFAPDALTSVASPDTLDRIIENCLAIQLHDRELARDSYNDLRKQVLSNQQRMYDTHVSIVLSPWTEGPASGPGSMFAVTIRWEYRAVPTTPVMRFGCVSRQNEYRELLDDPTNTIAWLFRPTDNVDARSPEAFQLLQFAVDGKQLPCRRTARGTGQALTVHLDEALVAEKREVSFSYTYRTLVRQHGHLLHLDIEQPTKGLHVDLLYKDCSLSHVNVLDYIASPQRSQIDELPASDPTPSVQIGYDGWVLPKRGVAFVWVLASELTPRSTPHALMRSNRSLKTLDKTPYA